MSIFSEAAAAHSAAVDDVFGERLQVRPQSNGSDFALTGDDPARAALARVITGSVTRRPLVTQLAGRGALTGDNARVVTAQWQVAYGAALGFQLRAGDLVVRLDPPFAGQILRLAEAEPIAGRICHPADQVA